MSAQMPQIREYEIHVTHPDVSGFELLEMLDLRSDLAARESEMTSDERLALEQADAMLVRNARAVHAAINAVADLAEMRSRLQVLPSQWWWYLDVLAEAMKAAA